MFAQSRKTIAAFFVLIDFHSYCTEPDSSHGVLFKGGASFVRKQLKGGAYLRKGLFEGRGVNQSLRDTM